jgi:hypothetical protein
MIPAKTKLPTVEINPARKELKGKVLPVAQYTNSMMPVTRMYNKYTSMILRRLGVLFLYPDQREEMDSKYVPIAVEIIKQRREEEGE